MPVRMGPGAQGYTNLDQSSADSPKASTDVADHDEGFQTARVEELKLRNMKEAEEYLESVARRTVPADSPVPEGNKVEVMLDVELSAIQRRRVHRHAYILGLATRSWRKSEDSDPDDDSNCRVVVFFQDGFPPGLPAPTWFESPVFASLSTNRLVYIPIYALLSTVPLMSGCGCALRLFYDCPTASRSIETLFGLGMFVFSFLWVNMFHGLRCVVRGADKNQKRLETDHPILVEQYCEELHKLHRTQSAKLNDRVDQQTGEKKAEEVAGETQMSEGRAPVKSVRIAHAVVDSMLTSQDFPKTLCRKTSRRQGQHVDHPVEEMFKWLIEDTGRTTAALRSDIEGHATVMRHLREHLTARERMRLFDDYKSDLAGVYEVENENQETADGNAGQLIATAKTKAYNDFVKEIVVDIYHRQFVTRLWNAGDDNREDDEQTEQDTLDAGEPSEQARTKKQQEDVREKLNEWGPFRELAFDVDENGYVRVRMKMSRLNNLHRMTRLIIFLGLVMFVVVFWISMGIFDLATGDFKLSAGGNTTSMSTPARVTNRLFFASTDCDASGPDGIYNQILAVLMLAVWTPATCIGTISLCAWYISLFLATALAADDVDDVMMKLDPRDIEKSFGSVDEEEGEMPDDDGNRYVEQEITWRNNVQLPAALLVSTMEQLSLWGVSMAMAMGSCIALSIGLMPMTMAMGSTKEIGALIAVGTLLPGAMICESLFDYLPCDMFRLSVFLPILGTFGSICFQMPPLVQRASPRLRANFLSI